MDCSTGVHIMVMNIRQLNPLIIVESTVSDPGVGETTSTANTSIGAEYTPTVDLPSTLLNRYYWIQVSHHCQCGVTL